MIPDRLADSGFYYSLVGIDQIKRDDVSFDIDSGIDHRAKG